MPKSQNTQLESDIELAKMDRRADRPICCAFFSHDMACDTRTHFDCTCMLGMEFIERQEQAAPFPGEETMQ
jgi:hypothetical protein